MATRSSASLTTVMSRAIFLDGSDLANARAGDSMHLRLTDGSRLAWKVRSNESYSEDGNNRVLVGETQTGGSLGRVILSQRGDILYASVIGAKEGNFQMLSDATGAIQVTRVVDAEVLDCGVDTVAYNDHDALATAHDLSNQATPAFADFDGVTSTTVQDIVIFFNDEARVALGGRSGTVTDDAAIRAKIQAAVVAANTAYFDSNIPLQLRALHVERVTYPYPVSEDFSRALSEVSTVGDGIIDQIHSIRQRYGADFVSLWLANSVTGGLANVLTGSTPQRAFSVVRAQNTIDTFVHELGHNQGCRHLRTSYSSTPSSWFSDSFAHRFTASGANYVTVMASTGDASSSNATRLLRFSAPEINYLGVSTGVTGSANTAATLRANRNIIAAFQTSFPGQAVIESTSTPSLYRFRITNGFPNRRYRVDTSVNLLSWTSTGTFLDTDSNGASPLGPPISGSGNQTFFRHALQDQ